MEDRDKLTSQILNGWAEQLADRWERRYDGNYRPASDEDYAELGFSDEEIAEGDVPLVFRHDDGTTVEVELEAYAFPISRQTREEKMAHLHRVAEQVRKANERRQA